MWVSKCGQTSELKAIYGVVYGNITLFRSIIVVCGIESTPWNMNGYEQRYDFLGNNGSPMTYLVIRLDCVLKV